MRGSSLQTLQDAPYLRSSCQPAPTDTPQATCVDSPLRPHDSLTAPSRPEVQGRHTAGRRVKKHPENGACWGPSEAPPDLLPDEQNELPSSQDLSPPRLPDSPDKLLGVECDLPGDIRPQPGKETTWKTNDKSPHRSQTVERQPWPPHSFASVPSDALPRCPCRPAVQGDCDCASEPGGNRGSHPGHQVQVQMGPGRWRGGTGGRGPIAAVMVTQLTRDAETVPSRCWGRATRYPAVCLAAQKDPRHRQRPGPKRHCAGLHHGRGAWLPARSLFMSSELKAGRPRLQPPRHHGQRDPGLRPLDAAPATLRTQRGQCNVARMWAAPPGHAQLDRQGPDTQAGRKGGKGALSRPSPAPTLNVLDADPHGRGPRGPSGCGCLRPDTPTLKAAGSPEPKPQGPRRPPQGQPPSWDGGHKATSSEARTSVHRVQPTPLLLPGYLQAPRGLGGTKATSCPRCPS
ncbi:hypothetical protein EI555_004709 [Monodon monoceros]|uniref:Uncharacterized protein n=1 Tax=Monodon monoceros TaxID=40151 RepID=A0A4U1ESZ9_MONMO|nr:hypothetical protein EI555_004709 [Monodon monoceros]